MLAVSFQSHPPPHNNSYYTPRRPVPPSSLITPPYTQSLSVLFSLRLTFRISHLATPILLTYTIDYRPTYSHPHAHRARSGRQTPAAKCAQAGEQFKLANLPFPLCEAREPNEMDNNACLFHSTRLLTLPPRSHPPSKRRL